MLYKILPAYTRTGDFAHGPPNLPPVDYDDQDDDNLYRRRYGTRNDHLRLPRVRVFRNGSLNVRS